MSTFKPMLAGKAPADLADLRFPVLASPKLDGIRCIIIGGRPMSRSLKPIPNEFVQRELTGLPDGLDGELMIGGGFNRVTSGIMSKAGEPDFLFHVFDQAEYPDVPFVTRLELARDDVVTDYEPGRRVIIVRHFLIDTVEELRLLDGFHIEQGFEGTMVRDPQGLYKYGRSTTREGWLLKIKLFLDAEAKVVGVEELMHNDNPAKINALGRTERSTHKANKRPAGTLGKLVCRTPSGLEFRIGTGFDELTRDELWEKRDSLLGRLVKYKYQPEPKGSTLGEVAPRIPVFLGFRDREDGS